MPDVTPSDYDSALSSSVYFDALSGNEQSEWNEDDMVPRDPFERDESGGIVYHLVDNHIAFNLWGKEFKTPAAGLASGQTPRAIRYAYLSAVEYVNERYGLKHLKQSQISWLACNQHLPPHLEAEELPYIHLAGRVTRPRYVDPLSLTTDTERQDYIESLESQQKVALQFANVYRGVEYEVDQRDLSQVRGRLMELCARGGDVDSRDLDERDQLFDLYEGKLNEVLQKSEAAENCLVGLRNRQKMIGEVASEMDLPILDKVLQQRVEEVCDTPMLEHLEAELRALEDRDTWLDESQAYFREQAEIEIEGVIGAVVTAADHENLTEMNDVKAQLDELLVRFPGDEEILNGLENLELLKQRVLTAALLGDLEVLLGYVPDDVTRVERVEHLFTSSQLGSFNRAQEFLADTDLRDIEELEGIINQYKEVLDRNMQDKEMLIEELQNLDVIEEVIDDWSGPEYVFSAFLSFIEGRIPKKHYRQLSQFLDNYKKDHQDLPW